MNPDALPEEFTPVPEGHRPIPAHCNRPSFHDIRTMPIGAVAALPGIYLALLQEDAEAALVAARTLKDWLEGAIALRYADRAAELRREQGKDTGMVRFADGDVVVVADLLKKVEWDQAQLVALVERIRAGGDDPAEYVEVAYKVPERKYAAWPARIREAFAPARTVRTGKPTFALSLRQEATGNR
jgi:hypothetical protein